MNVRFIIAMLALFLSYSTSAYACPTGCVPAADVAEQSGKTDPSFCGPGCVWHSDVVRYKSDEAPAAEAVVEEAAPQAGAAAPAEAQPAPEPPQPAAEPQPEPSPAPVVSMPVKVAPKALPPCPACPAGCVARAAVESLKANADRIEDTCPIDCVAIGKVKSLLDEPACCTTAASVQAQAEQATDVPTIRNVDATQNRIVFSPTAIGLKKGQSVITGYDFGLWEFQHGVTDNLQLGLITNVPVFVFGIVPTLRLHKQMTDTLYLSGGIFGAYFGFFEAEAWHTLTGGGSVEASFKLDNHIFNIGMTVMSGGAYDPGWSDGWNAWDAVLLIPNLGYRYAFHPNWSFQLELAPPIFVDTENGDDTTDGDAFTMLIFYGFRAHGDLMYGDFGFVFPASKWFKEHVWQYAPFGFPYFSLGFHF